MECKTLMGVSLGELPFDLVLQGGTLVNVLTGELYQATVGIQENTIAAVLPGQVDLVTKQVIDVTGYYIAPGLVDLYTDLGKTMLTPDHLASALLPLGVTASLLDVNLASAVFGQHTVPLMKAATAGLPLHFYLLAPIQVPVRPECETVAPALTAGQVEDLVRQGAVLGLGPLLNGREVLGKSARLAKLKTNPFWFGAHLAAKMGYLEEREKQGLLISGVLVELADEHNFSLEAAIRRGQYAAIEGEFLNEKTVARVLALKERSHFLLRAGSLRPDQIAEKGHLDGVVRKAIALGIPAADAIASATIRPARCAGLSRHGAVAPGFVADLLLLKSLDPFEIAGTIAGGTIWARDGKLLFPLEGTPFSAEVEHTVRMKKRWPHDFFFSRTQAEEVKVKALKGDAHSFALTLSDEILFKEGDYLVCGEDAVRIVMFERHGSMAPGTVGVLKGMGKIKGAIASTCSPYHGQLLVLGDDDEDMAMAANMLITSGGGMCAVQGGHLVASVDLPVGGIFSQMGMEEVAERVHLFEVSLKETMGLVHVEPLEWLFRLGNTALPGYHLTDCGIVLSESDGVIPVWPYQLTAEGKHS